MHDVDLSQKLRFADSDFLTALDGGVEVLSSYRRTLFALVDTLSVAMKTGRAGNETLSLAHSVASRILSVANCSLNIKHEGENYLAQLRVDLDVTLHRMDALSLGVRESKPSHSDGSPDTHSPAFLPTLILDTGSSSLSMAPAYRWLLDNLHNPYPTAEIKTRIAAASSCKVSSINSWFVNTRRRIGWTTLCRERFSNCRADMIDAAYRALVEEDSQRTLSPELRHSFVAMKATAESLYSSTFAKNTFAADPDTAFAALENVMENDRKSVDAGNCPAEQSNLTKTIQESYPSPDRSTTAPPEPTLDDHLTNEGEQEDIASTITVGFKRRRSSIEPPSQQAPSIGRPIKRLRASTSQMYFPSSPSITDAMDILTDDSSSSRAASVGRPIKCLPTSSSQTYLPSPPSSTNTNNILSDDSSSSSDFLSVDSSKPEANKASSSCKRCLSDVDATGILKRLRSSIIPPCSHIVSDPQPSFDNGNEHSTDDWLNVNFDALFDIPPPVDAAEPDFSVPWEVELFNNYSIPGNPKHAPRCLLSSTTDTQNTVPTDLPDIESLLQSIGGDAFVLPSESGSLSDIAGAPFTTSFDSSMPNMSQTIDWTLLLSGSHQPTTYSTFPEYPTSSQSLPEIDPSMLQLPQVMPTVVPQGDLASRQAKLHQLHAMQEVVRQMEHELQAEGIVI